MSDWAWPALCFVLVLALWWALYANLVLKMEVEKLKERRRR